MFDPYHKWLGIPAKEQPPHHYRLLGVELFEKDLDVIEGAADKQMAFVRQYQSGQYASEAAQLLNELAMARLCLLKPEKKADYDAKLRKKIAAAAKPDPEDSFADMELPDVPSTSLLELPKRKRKSRKKFKWPMVPASVIKYGTVAAILLVMIPFIPSLLKSIPRFDFASNTEQPAEPKSAIVIRQPAPSRLPEVGRSDNSVASKASESRDSSIPSLENTATPKRDRETADARSESMKTSQSRTVNQSEMGREKSTTTSVVSRAPAADENELVGGNGGKAKTFDLNGKTVIGVDWAPGEYFGTFALSKVIPIAAGSPPNPDCTRIRAPKGYAVGAINVVAPKYVSSLQLVFMKINDDGTLDPSDTKLSKWLGMKPKGEITTLSGEGRRVIGMQTRQEVVVDAIGILVEP